MVSGTHNLLTISPTPYHYTTKPPESKHTTTSTKVNLARDVQTRRVVNIAVLQLLGRLER